MQKSARVIAIAALATLAFGVGSRSVARHYLFPAAALVAREPLPGFVEHCVTAEDGVPVRALELPGPDGASVVVHFHNNREVAEQTESVARELGRRGLGVLLVEYRGYGGSGDAPSEDGLYADAEAALGILAARGISPARIVLWGTSLGTGVAAEMARRARGGRLVLITPYTSIPDLVRDRAAFVPAGLLIGDRFDTLSKADEISIPTVVVHGDADEIVPFHMGQRVVAAIRGATLLRVVGGHHGDLLQRAGVLIADVLAGVAR